MTRHQAPPEVCGDGITERFAEQTSGHGYASDDCIRPTAHADGSSEAGGLAEPWSLRSASSPTGQECREANENEEKLCR